MIENVIAADMSKAPESVRKEIEALKGRLHGPDTFKDLSPETRAWLNEQAMASNGVINKVVKHKYKELTEFMAVAEDGLTALNRLMPQEEADTINLDLYNACAKFVRVYNTIKMGLDK